MLALLSQGPVEHGVLVVAQRRHKHCTRVCGCVDTCEATSQHRVVPATAALPAGRALQPPSLLASAPSGRACFQTKMKAHPWRGCPFNINKQTNAPSGRLPTFENAQLMTTRKRRSSGHRSRRARAAPRASPNRMLGGGCGVVVVWGGWGGGGVGGWVACAQAAVRDGAGGHGRRRCCSAGWSGAAQG